MKRFLTSVFESQVFDPMWSRFRGAVMRLVCSILFMDVIIISPMFYEIQTIRSIYVQVWLVFFFAVQINQERAGIMVDRDIIKAAIQLFVEVDDKGKRFYYRNFEQVLLTDIDARCTKLAQEWISDCSFDEYITQVFLFLFSLGKYIKKYTFFRSANTCTMLWM